MSFRYQGPRVWMKSREAQNPSRLRSWVKRIWESCLLLVFGPLFIIKPKVKQLHVYFCWKALWRHWCHFSTELGTCTPCQISNAYLTVATLCLNRLDRKYGVMSRRRWDTLNNAKAMAGLLQYLRATGWSPLFHDGFMLKEPWLGGFLFIVPSHTHTFSMCMY